MKKLLTFIILAIGFQARCFSQSDTTSNTPIEISLKLKKEYLVANNKYYEYLHILHDTLFEKNYDIDITIKNKSTKPISIWLMSCSWLENFMINNNYVRWKSLRCDSNIPSITKFKPGESKTYSTTIIKEIRFCVYCPPQVKTTKLGLIVIDDIFNLDESKDYFLLMEDKSNRTIFWSNPLYLLE